PQPSKTVTVSYTTANGSALAGADYVAQSGTLSLSSSTPTRQVLVSVLGDTLDEPDETFSVLLSNPTNASITDAQGVGTITDDDPPPSLSIDDVSTVEGDSGTQGASFTVLLSAASGRPVTVNYATADGTATAGSDYAATAGTLT